MQTEIPMERTPDQHTRADVKLALRQCGCFSVGAHFIVDGQFGSTGKGLMASIYAETGGMLINAVTTNAGPNSGHTAYSPVTGKKFMTQQIPVASIVLNQMQVEHISFLNAGAIIDPSILYGEFLDNLVSEIHIHPNAAIIEQEDRDAEASGSLAAIASTGKGVGAALARKIMRRGNVAGNISGWWSDLTHPAFNLARYQVAANAVILVETAQGFSLGVNGEFYPHTTSRECTVLQAASDARLPWTLIKQVIACYRTYPIRVGDTAVGQSGSCYPDQFELTWDGLGIEPELTSVTKRVRRVFSWSRTQFRDSLLVNQPTVIFLNFANYLSEADLRDRITSIHEDYRDVMKRPLGVLLLGFGPYNSDVRLE